MTEYKYRTVVLNKDNIVPGTGNAVLKYNFPSSENFKKAGMTLTHLSIMNSWFNITRTLGNNKFSYKWFDISGNLSEVFDVEFQDGYYSVSSLNSYMQGILVSRGHYLRRVSSGEYVYHLEFLTSTDYYAIQLNCYAMRTESADYLRGSTSWGWPSQYTTVQIIIPSTNKFKELVGFVEGTYPEVSDINDHSFLSNVTPTMDPVSTLFLHCSLISQGGFSDPDDILYAFTAGNAPLGTTIEKIPPKDNYAGIRDGLYQSFTIEIKDQDYRRVNVRDPVMMFQLTFRQPVEV